MFKVFIGLTLSLMIIFTGITVFASSSAEMKSRVEEQYDIFLGISKSMYEDELMRRSSEPGNFIRFLIKADDDSVYVSLVDNSDEVMKAEILSLSGVDRELVRFVDIEIDWAGPRELTDEEVASLRETQVAFERTMSVRMGSVVVIAGKAWTVGSPAGNNSNFYTANHNYLWTGDPVFDGITGARIGTVDRYAFNGVNDVSRVNMASFGYTLGHWIFNMRGVTPPAGTNVTAVTGFSGNVLGTITLSSFNFEDVVAGVNARLHDMIAVRMQAQPGDSGAALVHNNSAIGIMSFGVRINGIPHAVFTKTTNMFF
jgi:hypothetical protein